MRLLAIMAVFVVLSMDSFAQSDECDYSVEILLEDNEFESSDFTWRMKAAKIEGGQTTITGTAKIEGKNGKTVKSYKPWSSEPISRQKTSSKYTPNLKPGEYEIIAEVSTECDDRNEGNNADKESITIKGSDTQDKEDKKEDEPNEEEAATVNEKPVKTVLPKTNLQPADNEIQLNANSKTKNSQPKLQSYAIKEETAYESSSEKAKGLILISLLALSILVNIVLIWKR